MRAATLDTSFRRPFLMWPSQHRNGNSNPVRFDRYEHHCVNYFWLHKRWIRDFLCMCQYLKRIASPIDQHPDILKLVTLSLSKDFVHYNYFRCSRFCQVHSCMAALSINALQGQISHLSAPPPKRLFVISQILGDTWPDPTRVSRRIGERTWERGCVCKRSYDMWCSTGFFIRLSLVSYLH